MVASSTGAGGPGSDRQCMADYMTKLLGDSVLILVLPFVLPWVFILLNPSATFWCIVYVQIADVAHKRLQLRSPQPLLLNVR